MKFLDNVGDPSCFPTPLPDCLCHVSFSRYSSLSLGSRRKTEQMQKFFGSQFFREKRPHNLYGILLAWFTVRRLSKFGWVPFADLRLWSLAVKWKSELTYKWMWSIAIHCISNQFTVASLQLLPHFKTLHISQ